jgi:glutathione S-transferase
LWKDGDNGKEASMYESLICNEFIDDAYPGPALMPPAPLARARARLLIDQFGAKFGAAFGRVMFSSGDGPEAAAAKAALDEALAWLDTELDAAGPYALGAQFTLADCAMAPFALRLPLLAALSGYKPPQGLARYERYAAALAARPSVKASMRPPEAGRPYEEQLIDTYKVYVAQRKEAAAAAAAK